MSHYVRSILGLLTAGLIMFTSLSADNQTATVSKIHSDRFLPFRIRLEKADFELPMGVQSFIQGIYQDKWLILTGRIDGLHGFVENSENNFPTNLQNTHVFVIDPIAKKTYVRSLQDPDSGLTQQQVDLLSVVAAQGYQSGKTLYIAGGYGVDSATGRLDTKDSLTAVDIPGLIHWVVNPSSGETAAEHIRQIFHPIFKVTGGYMHQSGDHPTLLIMGHEFNGFYRDPSQQPPVFQQYTEQVRRFRIHDDGTNLSVTVKASLPATPDPNMRRRDLNVVPVLRKVGDEIVEGFVNYSGVFTLTDGVWTVPIEITANGHPSMADPASPTTFKQGMSNYDCGNLNLFSEETGDMYSVFLGGISFGFFVEQDGGFQFMTDDQIPFINQTTAIRLDRWGKFTQYFLEKGGFPTILSTSANPGNPLLFGSEGEVILFDRTPKTHHDIIRLDALKERTCVGYFVGGIMSTLPNTNTQADSAPSPFLFKVFVEPIGKEANFLLQSYKPPRLG